MFKKLSKSAVSMTILAAVGAAAMNPASASAASAPLCGGRIALHFDLTKGQTPENIAWAPGETAYVTFAEGRQVAELSPSGTVRILATLPAPADGGVHTPALGFPLTTGIVRAADGTLHFLYAISAADLTGAWRPRLGADRSGSPHCPPTACPTDWRCRTLCVTDSVLGTMIVASRTRSAASCGPRRFALRSGASLMGVPGSRCRGVRRGPAREQFDYLPQQALELPVVLVAE
jgi:hypothetical protein